MVRLAICWLALPFAFFSACSGKLGTYILPCYPPLAFLIAVGVLKCLGNDDARGFVAGAWVVLSAAVFLLVALLVSLIAVPKLSDEVAFWKWVVAAAGLFLWGAFCWLAVNIKDTRRRLLLYSAGPVLFIFSWPLVIPATLEARKAPGAFLRANAARVSPESILVAENGLTAAVCWYYGRDNSHILGNAGEYAYGLSYADSRHRVLDIGQFRDMIAPPAGPGHVVLIIKSSHYVECREQLPKPSYEQIRGGVAWIEYTPTLESPTPVSQFPDGTLVPRNRIWDGLGVATRIRRDHTDIYSGRRPEVWETLEGFEVLPEAEANCAR